MTGYYWATIAATALTLTVAIWATFRKVMAGPVELPSGRMADTPFIVLMTIFWPLTGAGCVVALTAFNLEESLTEFIVTLLLCGITVSTALILPIYFSVNREEILARR